MRLATFLLKYKIPVLLVIAAVSLVLGYFSLQLPVHQNPDELFFKDDPEYPLLRAVFQQFGHDELLVALYTAPNVLELSELEAIQNITDALRRLQGVEKVLSLTNAQDVLTREDTVVLESFVSRLPTTKGKQEAVARRIDENPLYRKMLLSADSTSTLFSIFLAGDLNNKERAELLRNIERVFTTYSRGNEFYIAGSPSARDELFHTVIRDMSVLFPVAMLLLITSMYLIFRDYLSVLLPYGAVTLAVLWTLGIMQLCGSQLTVWSILLPTLLFVIGTSDCIHVISEYHQCRYTCRSKREALQETISKMVMPCFLNSVTTSLGFLSLLVMQMRALQTLGIYTAVGVMIAFVLAITVIPLGLAIGDTKGLTRGEITADRFVPFLSAMERMHIRYGKTILISTVLITVLSILGVMRLRVETDLANFGGEKNKQRLVTMHIEDTLGGVIPFCVMVDSGTVGGIKDPNLLRKVDDVAEFVRKQDGVDQVVGLTDLLKYMNYRLNNDTVGTYRLPENAGQVSELMLMASLSDNLDLLPTLVDEQQSKTIINIRYRYHDLYRIQQLHRNISSYLNNSAGFPAGVMAYSTGTSKLMANAMTPFLSEFQGSLLTAIVSILIIMVIQSRSFLLGLIGMVPNLIPVLLTLGIMGLFKIPLNLGTAPVASIAIGLAVDDTVHFLSRFRSELGKDGDYPGAIRRTMLTSGKPIITTAVVFTVGFGIFMLSDFQPTQNLGILSSLTMATSVFGDLIVLPVLLRTFKPLKAPVRFTPGQ